MCKHLQLSICDAVLSQQFPKSSNPCTGSCAHISSEHSDCHLNGPGMFVIVQWATDSSVTEKVLLDWILWRLAHACSSLIQHCIGCAVVCQMRADYVFCYIKLGLENVSSTCDVLCCLQIAQPRLYTNASGIVISGVYNAFKLPNVNVQWTVLLFLVLLILSLVGPRWLKQIGTPLELYYGSRDQILSYSSDAAVWCFLSGMLRLGSHCCKICSRCHC